MAVFPNWLATLPKDLDILARMSSCQMVSYKCGKVSGKLIVATSAEALRRSIKFGR